MNDAIRAVVLGATEGLTEFLPVSSTGHMILVQPLLGVDPEEPLWRAFLFVTQFAAIAAVVLYFWRDLWRKLSRPLMPAWREHLGVKLAAAMAPTILGALLLEDLIETQVETASFATRATAIGLIVGAVLIELIDRRFRRPNDLSTVESITLRQAALIGLIQLVSMWPGVSRSGATIMGGMALGLTPLVAAEFSFYLAIPTMLAAAGWRLLKHHEDLSAQHFAVIGLGSAVAFVVALAVIAGFLGYVRRYRFTPFVVYRVALGAAVLTWA